MIDTWNRDSIHILLMIDDMFKIQCVQLKELIIKSEVWL
jgi:hypothetical protein